MVIKISIQTFLAAATEYFWSFKISHTEWYTHILTCANTYGERDCEEDQEVFQLFVVCHGERAGHGCLGVLMANGKSNRFTCCTLSMSREICINCIQKSVVMIDFQ